MLSADVLIKFLDINKGVLERQFNGLTHEDSLLQVPFRGNCLNWVIGHIVNSRDSMLRVLDQETFLNEEQKTMYEPGSEPLTHGSKACDFNWLWDTYQKQYDILKVAIESKSVDELEQIVEDSDRSVGERLRFLMWHETYHVGQTEYLRQLAGTDDKVI